MKIRHLLLVLLVVAVWGFNFVAIEVGLHDMPPILFAAVRFVLAAFPFVLFVKPPRAPARLVIAYGLFTFVMQFAFLFSGMRLGVSAGLTSLILQLQVFFTIGVSSVVLGERPTAWQIVGALISFSGIAYVGLNVGGDVTLIGLACLIAAAASWAVGNVVSKQLGRVDMFSLVVWGSMIAWPPLLVLAWIMEPASSFSHLIHLPWPAIVALCYIVYLSTHLGYGIWGRLLSLYPAAAVAPFTLLVPIFGFLGSTLFLDETFDRWKLVAAILVLSGLCLNLFGSRLAARQRELTG